MFTLSKKIVSKVSFLLIISFNTLPAEASGLAVNPGVTTNLLDKIDQIGDEKLRELFKTAVWPGFGEHYLDLDRPDAELTEFEKNYKLHPLNWNQKIENVRFVLDQADDISALNTENVEYMDIAFGESVIPVTDRRVTEILNNNYLGAEAQKLAEEKQIAMADLYKIDQENIGDKLQTIEDEYAIKLATLVQAENKYKEAKIAFLKLENQKKYGRIDDETYQKETREIVANFEAFFEIGSEVAVFNENKIKQLGSSIYDDSIRLQSETAEPIPSTSLKQVNEKAYYWTISIILMLLALLFGYLGFNKLQKNHKKTNF